MKIKYVEDGSYLIEINEAKVKSIVAHRTCHQTATYYNSFEHLN